MATKKKKSAEERTLGLFIEEAKPEPVYVKPVAKTLVVPGPAHLGDFTVTRADNGEIALRRLTSKTSWIEFRMTQAELSEAARLLDDR